MLPAIPLIQAPMAAVQDARLAVAVGETGALGSLAAAMLSGEQLRAAIGEFEAAGVAYHLNFFAHRQPEPDPGRQAAWLEALAPFYAEYGVEPAAPSGPGRRPFDDEALEAVLGSTPALISFHFGLPEDRLFGELRRRTSAPIASSATTVGEARWLAEHGVDVVIAQGWEAGGHRGHFLSGDLGLQSPTLALVGAITAAIDLPVVAAGGITTPQAARAALAAGATAVQCGTAFLLADEALTSPLHRAAIAAPHDTVVTSALTGRPARGIPNRLIVEAGEFPEAAPPFPLAAGALAPLRAAAEAAGRADFTPLWCGASTEGVRSAPAAEIVAHLMG